jgi:tungstate transport system ATP-binding protein
MASILPLRLHELSFKVNGRRIIDRVSLAIESGASTVILGANGAGKSVLMRLMHGLLVPSGGRIEWGSEDPRRLRRAQAMVFQQPVMLRRSAIANVVYALACAGVQRAEREVRALNALDSVRLRALAHRQARTLSVGEQQRVALARAWALNPEVLFLDEPTASLDPGATREIERVIRAIAAAGAKVVMSTHNLGQAKRLGGEILFLHEGRLAERAPVDRFFAEPTSAEAEAFIRGELPWT